MLRHNAARLPAPPFPAPVLFDDVDEAVLAREDEDAAPGPWQAYMSKMLAPAGKAFAAESRPS